MTEEAPQTGETPAADLTNRSASDNIKEVTQAGKQIFAAGQQLVKNLNELQRRVEHATDLRSQLSERPWLIAVLALAGGLAGWRFFSHRHRD